MPQNQTYPKFDARIADTMQCIFRQPNKISYDAYIKAFVGVLIDWTRHGGIICFVSNGAWLRWE